MTALFIETPLDFSSFPTVLLIATMLRLALNLAIDAPDPRRTATTGAHAAGHVIEAFGDFVMGGDFVIGMIVFAILVIVNFVVITKGSGRIAEVAARFTLDAMPGKQMAIDADLSAGLIDEDRRAPRRKELEEESAFFGAMDGAAKFVRGDAIAGLLITFINIIGGIIIGVVQEGMTFAEAAATYTTADRRRRPGLADPGADHLDRRRHPGHQGGVRGSADKALVEQFTRYPMALGMSAGVMALMALLPGMPIIPFLLLAGGVGYLAFTCAPEACALRQLQRSRKRRRRRRSHQAISRGKNHRSPKVSRSTTSRSSSATGCSGW